MKHRWFALLALAFSATLWAQDIPQGSPGQPPRSDIESSSNDTKVDTSAPRNDAKDHPDSDVGDVMEFHPFDPHKAMKAVEVGDYYFNRYNYRAAASRYEEALVYKPNDADATFKLAQTLEKLKQYADARENYADFLKIISQGKQADEARKALERLPKDNDTTAKQ